MNRIALLSDIHGNIPALEAVVSDLNRRQVDTVVNLGDHISGPLWPKETINVLEKQDWLHILGNHDRNLINQDPAHHGPSDKYAYALIDEDDKKWISTLPPYFELPNGMFLFHGTPVNDNVYLLETVENGRIRLATQKEILTRLKNVKKRIMICGHTHIQRVVNLQGDIMIVNPGSVGLQAYDNTVPETHIVETGSPHARYSILDYANGTWSVEMLLIEYDYNSAVKQAEKNNRPDWAIGLKTGFMV